MIRNMTTMPFFLFRFVIYIIYAIRYIVVKKIAREIKWNEINNGMKHNLI